MATLGQFYTDVLAGVGAPVTQGNLLGLAGIAQTEGVNDYYNPFNIEWKPGQNASWKGVSNFNSVGVQRYGSYQQGVQATVAFLKANSHWNGLIAALKTGDKGSVDASLKAAYTWAAFKPVSNDTGLKLLARDIGSGTPGSATVSAPNAPFPTGTLSAPLNDAQAATIAAYLTLVSSWIVTYTGSAPNRAWHFAPAPGNTNPARPDETDAQIITDYYAVQGGTATGTVDTVPVWQPALEALENTVFNATWWKRAGIVALGAIVIGVAVYMLLRSDGNAPSPKHLAEGAIAA